MASVIRRDSEPTLPFLSGGSVLAGLIADFDWSSTPLGSLESWPQTLKTTVALILRSPVPIVTLWGEDGVMIYNDAYSVFAGARHPGLLGSRVRDGWEEVADFNDNIMRVVLAGGTLAYRDQELTLFRNGAPEQVWLNLDYSPTVDEDGKPIGVIAIVVETTEKVKAERRLVGERERLSQMFAQAPGFMALLQGPEHRIVLANRAYETLVGRHDIVGKTVAEALPEPAAKSYVELLDQVYRTGQAFSATGWRYAFSSSLDERFVDFIFQPITDSEGAAGGVFIEGIDVTQRHVTEELLRMAQEGGGVGAFEWFPETGRLSVSDEYRRIWGLAHDSEVTTDRLVQAVLPDDRPRTGAARLGQGENPLEYSEFRIRRPDTGEVRWLARRGEVLGGGQGDARRYVGVAFDITERKLAEQALREAELRLRLALDAAAIGVWEYHLNADRLIWDARVREVAEVEAGVEVNWNDDFLGVVHPDDRHLVLNAFASLLEAESPPDIALEFRVVGRRSGRITWAALEGRRMVDPGGDVRIIGTARDVTAERTATSELHSLNQTLEERVAAAVAERQLWADMFEGADDPVAAVGPDLRYLAMNTAYREACERLMGVRLSVGDSVSGTLAHLPAAQSAAEYLWRKALEGEALDFSESGQGDADGLFYDLKFRPLFNRDGAQIGAFQYSRDVTERVRAQRALSEAEDALRQSQKMDAVGQLTGGIAHDFNNMLAVIIGSLDLLERRADVADPRARTYLDAARDGARRAAQLTQRLLAFSRQQPLKPEPIDANALVSGMSTLLRHSLGERVRMETVLAGGLWRTHADPNQLENVVLNLAVNARDAMSDGGRLTIETQNAHLDARYAAENPGAQAGQYVMIAVTDTGAGMTAEVISKAFDPFFTTKGVGKGTGLGLSQVYGFVKQSGGHLKIYSEVGHGTSVKIYLPRLTDESGATFSSEPRQPVVLGDRQEVVLVVEDEPNVRQFSAAALIELGYGVLEADGAAAALSLLDAHPEIALLFTDVVMPDLNGRKLADEALRRRPDLKVLYTTGYSQNAVVHNGVLDAGVELISKPFAMEELGAKVRDVLDRTQPGSGLPDGTESRASPPPRRRPRSWRTPRRWRRNSEPTRRRRSWPSLWPSWPNSLPQSAPPRRSPPLHWPPPAPLRRCRPSLRRLPD